MRVIKVLPLVTFAILGFILRLYSDLIGSIVFWVSIILLLFLTYTPLRSSFKRIANSSRMLTTWIIFIPYLLLHFFIYAIALERLLSWIYNLNFGISNFSIIIATVGRVADFQSFLLSIFFSPSILILIPPTFTIDLSFFSIFTGIIISILVTSNLLEVIKIWRFSKRYKTLILVPTFGVISGASCCIGIPSVLLNFLPLSQIAIISTYGFILLFLYISLPIITLIALSIIYSNLCKFNSKFGNTS